MGNFFTLFTNKSDSTLWNTSKGRSLSLQQLSFSLVGSHHSGNKSVVSAFSTYSQVSRQSRPWSKISRRQWHESTLSSPLNASKTAWPVTQVEALFLPEFSIQGKVSRNDFDIKEFIAKGSYGRVYRAIKKDTEQVYAVKILSKSLLVSEDLILQVKAEVKIQSMCGHHPFIVNAPFYWQDRKNIYIVSQFYSGGDMLDLVRTHSPLPEHIVQIYLAELSLAIDYLHNAGVIYRDIKPENVLLDEEGHAHLTDFGLSKWLPMGQRTTTMCGTDTYMAPEIGNCECYSHAVDWWSLGVLTHLLISSKYPGDYGALNLIPSVSNTARSLISRLLNKDPRSRLRSVMTLEIDPFYKGFKFPDIRARKISPKKLLEEHLAQRKGPDKIEDQVDETNNFDGF